MLILNQILNVGFCLFLVCKLVLGDEAVMESKIPLNSFSLRPPFIDDYLKNRYWDFGGDSVVDIENLVRLTPSYESRSGWLWTKDMIHSDSWEILVEFKITSPNIALSADGLAFWFTPSTYENGQAMGFKTTWNGLGIIIDTYDNADYGFSVPKIIGIVNDGTKKYNKDSNGKEIETASCEMDVKDQSYKTIARIRYHKDRFLSLEFSTKEQDLWKSCFHLTNVTLPSSGYLGFTGLTGGLSENHDIMYVIVRDLEETTSDSIPKTQFEDAILNYETFNTAYNSSFNLWTWSLVLIVALVVGLGYRYLPKMVRKDYQRF